MRLDRRRLREIRLPDGLEQLVIEAKVREAGDRLGWDCTADAHPQLVLQVNHLDVAQFGDIGVLDVEVLHERFVGNLGVVDRWEGVDVLVLGGCDRVAVGIVVDV